VAYVAESSVHAYILMILASLLLLSLSLNYAIHVSITRSIAIVSQDYAVVGAYTVDLGFDRVGVVVNSGKPVTIAGVGRVGTLERVPAVITGPFSTEYGTFYAYEDKYIYSITGTLTLPANTTHVVQPPSGDALILYAKPEPEPVYKYKTSYYTYITIIDARINPTRGYMTYQTLILPTPNITSHTPPYTAGAVRVGNITLNPDGSMTFNGVTITPATGRVDEVCIGVSYLITPQYPGQIAVTERYHDGREGVLEQVVVSYVGGPDPRVIHRKAVTPVRDAGGETVYNSNAVTVFTGYCGRFASSYSITSITVDPLRVYVSYSDSYTRAARLMIQHVG